METVKRSPHTSGRARRSRSSSQASHKSCHAASSAPGSAFGLRIPSACGVRNASTALSSVASAGIAAIQLVPVPLNTCMSRSLAPL